MSRRAVLLLFAVLVFSAGAAAQHQEPQSAPAAKPEAAAQHEQPAEEAAAETDPHAEFKESASVKKLAKLFGISLSAAYWVSISLNFAVILFFMRLAYLYGIPGLFPAPGPYMRERTALLRRQMEEAQRASEAAAQRMRDIEARLASLDTEISGLRTVAEQEGLREEERLLAAAAEEKRKIVSGAEQEITAAAKAARAELRAYAAELAVGLASKQIQVNESTDQALVREFVDQLGKDAR
jgi:F-type H+-transporting ATPase subunit b